MKTALVQLKTNPKWVALQAVAIIGSILLAFAIDAWWTEKQEQEEASNLLAVFGEELADNVDRAKKAQRFRRAKRESAIKLIELAAGSASDESLDTLINDIMHWEHTPFSSGALEALTLGGKLAFIEPLELQAKIAGWHQEIEFVNRIERQDYESYHVDLLPFLRERASILQISNAWGGKPGDPEYQPDTLGNTYPISENVDHSALLTDREFVSLVTVTIWDQEDALFYLERFLEAAEELSVMIQEKVSE